MQKEITPNVLLVTIDSLRADYLGCYNPTIRKENISPNIDSFAEECFLFKNSFSQGNRTSVSFPAIFSGQYAFHYGYEIALHKRRKTIAQILKERKYSTAGFHSNPYISRGYNYERGFDLYEDNLNTTESLNLNKKLKTILRKLSIFFSGPYKVGSYINKQVLSWLRKSNKPYFLWVHYMDTHGPYIRKRGLKFVNVPIGSLLWHKCLESPDKISDREHQTLIASYKEEIKYVDKCFRELLNGIDVENTIIILTADHGELLGEHGIYGHDHNHFDPLFKVPLLIRLSSNFSIEPKIVFEKVQSIDICPTILNLLSIESRICFDGISLLPYIKGEKKEERKYIIHEIQKNYFCIRNDRYKYVLNLRRGQIEILFDLINDPDEKSNYLDKKKNDKDVSFLIETLKRHMALDRINDVQDIESLDNLTDEIKERLKGLGYL